MRLILSYPWWFILLCLLLGGVFSFLLYFWKSAPENKNDRFFQKLLAALRFFAISLLAFLLLAPLIKTKKTEYDKPILIFLKDNSASIGMKLKEKNAIEANWNKVIAQLSKDYSVKSYNFSDKLEEDKPWDFKGKETDISSVFSTIIDRHANQNIGGLVIATDGIYNKGISPIYSEAAKSFPIFPVALGDTTIQKDLFINGLSYSEVVYLGDKFNLNISVRANYLQGKTTQVEVVDPDGKLVYNYNLNINANDFSWNGDVVLDANTSGVRKYTVRVKQVAGETTSSNNSELAFVEVLDARQKTIVLYDAPHPDIKTLRYVLEQNKNYQLEVKDVDEFTGSIADYGLVVLHGLPSKSNKIQKITSEIAQLNKPVLYILTGNTDISAFNQVQKSLMIASSGKSGNETGAIFNQNFSKFTTTPDVVSMFEKFPPLLSPFGTYKPSASAEVLFKQQIGRVATENPLVLLDQNLQQRIGIIAGEGIWRWRMQNYERQENFIAFDELFGKVFQFLSVKSDNRRFRLKVAKNVFGENESVRFDAELYNESMQLVNDPDVTLIVKNDKGLTYTFVMDKAFNAYALDAGQLPEGNYTAIAKCSLKGKAYSASVNFAVRPIIVESVRLQADHGMLFNLAKTSGGKLFYPKDLKQLPEAINANKSIKPLVYEYFKTRPLIDMKGLFFIAFILLAVEWFIRKYRGGF
ncbi:MAG: hypothetical protein K1X55_05340 [Chitinophagales bacterium]|nr:hypothetical protein [Chitinophagales bacterium]